MATFPFDCAIYGSFAEGAASRAVIRTQMEVGRAKTRRRSSMGSRPIGAAYAIGSAEVDEFKAWYASAIGLGAESFQWTDPRTRTLRVVRFVDDGWQMEQISPKRWRLTIRVEEWA